MTFRHPEQSLDDEKPWTTVTPQHPQFIEAAQDVGVATEKDASIFFRKCAEPRKRFGIWSVLRGPRETVRSYASFDQEILDAGECILIEANEEALAAIIDGLNMRLGRRRQIHNLAFFIGIETLVVDLQVVQENNDDLLTEIFSLANFRDTFRGGKCVGRGEQDHRLAPSACLSQSLFPTLTSSDAVEVEKYVIRTPSVCAEPLLESDGENVVLAGVADEKARQGEDRCYPLTRPA